MQYKDAVSFFGWFLVGLVQDKKTVKVEKEGNKITLSLTDNKNDCMNYIQSKLEEYVLEGCLFCSSNIDEKFVVERAKEIIKNISLTKELNNKVSFYDTRTKKDLGLF